MLISMPTGPSTITGVFQVIRVSQVVWRKVAPRLNLRPPRTQRKYGRPNATHLRHCLTTDTSLLDKAISLLDKFLSLLD